jgi:hypothetical protein
VIHAPFQRLTQGFFGPTFVVNVSGVEEINPQIESSINDVVDIGLTYFLRTETIRAKSNYRNAHPGVAQLTVLHGNSFR